MAKMRLLTELVVLAMEDIQTKCLQKEQGKDISVHLRALHDAMNKARYFLDHLEKPRMNGAGSRAQHHHRAEIRAND